MQKKSIYNDKYQPLFIQEMDPNKLKDFSKILSQKLRHVKLAISKAALGQNKFGSLGASERARKEQSNAEEKKIKLKETSNYGKQNKGKIKLQPLSYVAGIKSSLNTFELTPTTILNIIKENQNELEAQIGKFKKPFQMLVKKTKINPKISDRKSFDDSFDSRTEDREEEEKILRQLLK